MRRKVACFLVTCLAFASVAGAAQLTSQEKAAVTAARKWLRLVDEGRYGESWRESAPFFRSRITQQRWRQASQSVRKPLGALVSRHLKTAVYKTSLPGAPDGQYVVMQFASSFRKKASAVETLTAVLGKRGAWRVVGYFIR